jgi:hypothetical protein
MRITDEQLRILITHRGNTIESQVIRKELLEKGLKFCGTCISLKETPASFHRNNSNLDGRNTVCITCCKKKSTSNARMGMQYFMFTSAERDERYRARMTPADRAAYARSGQAA